MEEKKDTKPIDELVTLKPNVIGKEHYFEYVNGIEVMCTTCPLGYGVTPDTTVKDGHIYIHGKLIV